ncbi:MAG: PAS domain S-box protein [Janthinobacterium lividum]
MNGAALACLTGGGEMGALLRGLDWAASPAGPPAGWPQGLRTALRLLLSSPQPMFVWWGPELLQFYNDPYRQALDRALDPALHPSALGASARNQAAAAWPSMQPHVEAIMAGNPASWDAGQVLPIRIHGQERPAWWTCSLTPIDQSGAPHETGGVLAVCRDVTAGHSLCAAAPAERLAERRRLSIESTVDYAIIAMDLDGRVTDWNAGAERMLGWSAQEMQGERADRLFTAADRAEGRPAAEMRRARDTGRIDEERRHLRKDGSAFWASGETMLMRDRTGAPLGLLKVLRDISERKRAEAALQETNATLARRVEERTRALRDSEDFTRLALTAVSGVGVWTYDIASDRFVCDAAVAELYGLDPVRAAAGLSRTEFLANVHPDDRAPLRATMGGGLKQSGDLELEYRLCHADGTVRWVLSRGHTYFDADGRPVRRTGVGIETTTRRQLEQQLRQSQKMEAVGQLTGGLAHDFNNLLTGVTGSLELLQTRIAQGRFQEVERFVNAAQGATRRAAALTHRLLAFSRQQTLDPRPTDVNRLVAGMEELIQRTVGPAIAVEPVAAVRLWFTLVDAGQLENALLNLCLNARDAMPDGGRIIIETGNACLDERAALERELPAGQYVTLTVRDTGTGMPPGVIARAFDPFFTTKPIGQGTGLGLSMIYGFARQSGGQVRITSEVGRGTAVCLYLPRHQGTAEHAETAAEAADAQRAQHGETVLVVDDEPTVRMLVTEVLEDLDYTAIEAADGATGLQVVRSDARIDLLITDVGLPGGMNGRQMAEAARRLRPGLKVLFITGYAEKAVLSHGHLEPGMHVLTKPFGLETLASRVKGLIAGP